MKKETTLHIRDKIEKIFILRTSSINHTIKVIDELKSKYPKSKITLLTQYNTERIFEDNSKADEIINCKKAGDYSFGINLGLIKNLRESYYDMTVVLYRALGSNRDFRANILSSFIKSKYKFANNFRYEWIDLGVQSPVGPIIKAIMIILIAVLKYLTRPFSKILQKVFYDFPILIYSYLLYFIRKTCIM
ncbi:hypothetical protein KKB18_00435, partial [bacterium]|nr:hypothetical protein [bacterium]